MKRLIQYKKISTACIFFAGLVVMSPAFADGGGYEKKFDLNYQGDFLDDRMMYAIGGGTAISGAASTISPLSIGIGGEWNINLGCGGFSLAASVENQLKNAVDGVKDMLNGVLNNVMGYASNYAAIMLQRANPGLYEMITNGIMQARMDFDRSKLSCEAISKKMADMTTSNSWKDMSLNNLFKTKMSTKDDMVQQMKEVEEENDGSSGIVWVGGEAKGGKDQDPILLVEDTVVAGYNALHGQGHADVDNKELQPDCNQGGTICKIWPKAQDAANFATKVLGESKIRTYEGSPPKETSVGTGLTRAIEDEFRPAYEALEKLIAADATVTPDKLEKAGSRMLPISKKLVEALRLDPERQLWMRRIASEVALTRVMEQGLLLERLLIAGSKNPNIEEAKAAGEDLKKTREALTAELQSLKLEYDMRKEATQITELVLALYEAKVAAAGAYKNNSDPIQDRILNLESTGPVRTP